MKTQTEARVVTTASTESRDFTIKANGKAFRILIDGLYENKIQSIVREIWSNALDSHAAAGCEDRAFTVSFPSMYNPVFSVRDYGTSLSHDDIMRLYTTVFESTKEDTNAAVGKFGLGSKSPFAYTDTFTVTATMDGEKRLYSALIAEDGVPQIHFLGAVESDEENGIEVSFPIETRDIDAFRKAARRVSHGFEVKPLVSRHESDEMEFQGWPELPMLAEGDGWTLLSGNIEGYSSRAYAKMGCVLYPINIDAITDLTLAERKLLQSTMVVEFPVGDLEINASREALSYGPKDPTVASIRNRIRSIVAEMVKSFEDQYAACDTYWEACSLFRKHLAGSIPTAVEEHLRKNAKFRGVLLKTHITLGTKNTSDIVLETAEVQVCTVNKLSNAAYRFDYYSDLTSVPATDETVIVIEDLSLVGKDRVKRVPAKLKQAHLDERFTTLVWIKFHGGKKGYKALGQIKRRLKGANVRDAADLPEFTTLSDGGRVIGIRRPVQVREHSAGRFDDRADLTPEDFAEGGYYVPLERMQPQYPSNCAAPGDVWHALRGGGFVESDAVLYGAPKSLWKHFEGDQWVNIYDLAKETFRKNQPKKKVAKARMIERVLGDADLRYMHSNVPSDDLMQSSVARRAVEFYENAASATKPAVDHIIRVAVAVGERETVEGWAKADFPELESLTDELEKTYPLMSFFQSHYYMRDEVDKFRHYVQVCDKAAEHDSLQTETTAAAA